MKKGYHKECKAFQTGIDVAYRKDSSVEWGEIVVEGAGGEWKIL
ncbi:MAG: hypothetical protein WC178_02995 [Candidatus Paceibacterota bacterium]